MRFCFVLCFAFATTLFASTDTWTHAQEDALNRPATFTFEIDANKLFVSAEKMGVDIKELKKQSVGGPAKFVTIGDIVRMEGAIGFTQDVNELMRPRKFPPVDAYLRIKLSSPELAEKVLESLKESGNAGEVKINGVTYIAENKDKPRQMLAHLSDMTEIEIGTGNYILRSDRNVLTPRLKESWSKLPEQPVRFAVDIKGNEDLIRQASKLAEENAPPMAVPFVKLIDNVESIQGSLNLENQNMLSIVFNCVDDSNATELREGLDGIFGIVKLGAGEAMKQVARDFPSVAKPLKEIVQELGAKAKGKQVTFNVSKPEGLPEAISKIFSTVTSQADFVSKQNRFRHYGLAAFNYHDVYKRFPFNPEDKISWRARVLVFMELQEYADQLDLDKGANAAVNKKFANKMPSAFGSGDRNSDVAWIRSSVKRFADVTDGTSNTIMLIENRAGQPWLENNSLSIDEAVKLVKSLKDGDRLVAAMYDGSVTNLTNQIEEEKLRLLLDPKDGKPVRF